MAYNRTQVRELLNATERDLFEASLAAHVKTLTGAQLRGKLGRTRALRDKYRDLLRRQKIATRGRTGSKLGISGVANQRTEQKMVVLAEVLERFEKRSQQLDAAQARAAEKTAAAATRLAREQARSAGRKRPAAKAAKPARPTKAPPKKAAAAKTAKTAAPRPAKTATAKKVVRPAAAKTTGAVLRGLLEQKRAGAGEAVIVPPRSRKARAKAPATEPGSIGPTSESARAAKQQLQAGGQRIQGHVGTQVRRAQAKRDQRGS